jgi:hypothetical protein
MQICETAWRQRRATGRELQEGFALGGAHASYDVNEIEESSGIACVAKFWFDELKQIFTCPFRALLT